MSVTGSSADILSRVRKLIPRRWFKWAAPYRDAILGGLSDSAAWNYGLIGYAKAQTRLATAYGIWLDILAYDFLGRTLTRNGAPDDAFRAVIKATILQERVTRQGMISALTTITSNVPFVFEPWNTFDTGAYSGARQQGVQTAFNITGTSGGAGGGLLQLQIGDGSEASVNAFNTGDVVIVQGVTGTSDANGIWTIEVLRLGVFGGRINLVGSTAGTTDNWTGGGTISKFNPQPNQYGSMGYGVGRGGYGNMQLPAQTFVKVWRGFGSGVPYVDGYGNPIAGYGQGAIEYVGPLTELSGITDAMIYQVINMAKPTGSTVWVQFETGADPYNPAAPAPPSGSPSLDFSQPGNSMYLPAI